NSPIGNLQLDSGASWAEISLQTSHLSILIFGGEHRVADLLHKLDIVRHTVGESYDQFAFAAVFHGVLDRLAAIGDHPHLGRGVRTANAFLQELDHILLRAAAKVIAAADHDAVEILARYHAHLHDVL